MNKPISAAYDSVAETYAALFLHELESDVQSKKWLDAFIELAREQRRPVVDVGCGPGSTVDHLNRLGLQTVGIDISPGQLREARQAFPELQFELGDFAALSFADGTLGGMVARHAIIHLEPAERTSAFAEWRRVLSPGAPLFVSFFGSRSADAHGTSFDHKVATAYELHPATIEHELAQLGFTAIQTEANPIGPGGRPFDHTTILACSAR